MGEAGARSADAGDQSETRLTHPGERVKQPLLANNGMKSSFPLIRRDGLEKFI
jgi:hypothetical protein